MVSEPSFFESLVTELLCGWGGEGVAIRVGGGGTSLLRTLTNSKCNFIILFIGILLQDLLHLIIELYSVEQFYNSPHHIAYLKWTHVSA